MSQHRSSQYALSMSGWLIAIAITLVLFTIFTPTFPHTTEKSRQSSCASNKKQIAVAFLMYIEDNDEKFPPASSVWRSPASGLPYPQDWGATQQFPATHGRMAETVPGILTPYIKNASVWACPSVLAETRDKSVEGHFTYRYNDLAAKISWAAFSLPAHTVLFMEGEDQIFNTGHSWEPNLPPQRARFTPDGTCPPGGGATVQEAPRRHADGANYAFGDGHVKWMKPDAVFFPPRASADKSHLNAGKQVQGPDPNATYRQMNFDGHLCSATFHVN